MKIRILSDLHLEFKNATPPAMDEADVVVLAGDIHAKTHGITWAIEHFPGKPVVMVLGNHEFYGGYLKKTMEQAKERAVNSNVHLLDNEAFVFKPLIDGVEREDESTWTRFLGCTLWTDYALTGNEPLAFWDAQQSLTDFKRIRDDIDGHYGKIRPQRLHQLHRASRRWLEEQLATPFAGKTVVVTHHAPTEQSIHARYKQHSGSHLNASYASRLDMLLGLDEQGSGVHLWVHGHTHDSWDYDAGGTRVVCNPRGYMGVEENPEFDWRKSVCL